jgi:hypothetical protein
MKNAFLGRIGYADSDAVNQLVERFGINIGDRLSRKRLGTKWLLTEVDCSGHATPHASGGRPPRGSCADASQTHALVLNPSRGLLSLATYTYI